VSIDWFRAVWTEPRAADADGPTRRDAVLVAVVAVAACVETILRTDLAWPVPSLLVALLGAAVLPWRRVRPLVATAIVVGTASAVQVAALTRDVEWDGLYTALFVLLLPYSLGRWGSGRDVLGGAGVFAVPIALTAGAGGGIEDVVGGIAVVLLAGAVGAGVRYRKISRRQHLDSIRSHERAELARELHDTVAHHVSAIAVQAQAGRTLAGTDADAVAEVLAVIEEEASRTLEEMRSMVASLREFNHAALAPQQGVHDLQRLAGANGSAPSVSVELHGALGDLRPSVDAALYRLAQEAITNARRHAHRATHVTVRVVDDTEFVQLTVDDDGRGVHPPASGYGLVGMAERAKLLGGTFSAGPRPDGGWNVTAVIPRRATSR
jgi:signal transduction histidine kinase